MNRKDFIAITLPLGPMLTAIGQTGESTAKSSHKIPAYLRNGDTVGITSPAGFITREDILPAKLKLEDWGFKVKIGDSIGKRDFTFGGSDVERAADLQAMMDDEKIKAILFARGGYGGVRIIDKLNFNKFARHPKWLIGFSDATLFHSHLHANFGIPSLHSKMCNSFPKDWSKAEPIQVETINSIDQCLRGQRMEYHAPVNLNNRNGKAEAILIGGNLSILENMAGSKSDISTSGKILFLEEVDEYLYSVDRMLWNLARSGKFRKLKGLIVGGFNRLKPDLPGEEFGISLTDMILEKVAPYNYPVCFDFPVGHQKNNFALKCGMMHSLVVNEEGAKLETGQV